MSSNQCTKAVERELFAQLKLQFTRLRRKLYRGHSADGCRVTYFVDYGNITRNFSTLQGVSEHLINVAN